MHLSPQGYNYPSVETPYVLNMFSKKKIESVHEIMRHYHMDVTINRSDDEFYYEKMERELKDMFSQIGIFDLESLTFTLIPSVNISYNRIDISINVNTDHSVINRFKITNPQQ